MSQERRKGILFVVSGPSGAGKGTVCKALREKRPDLKLSVSATTRQPREGELEGVHYFFKTQEEFAAMRERGEFLEWAQVYGNCYGTPVSFVKKTLEDGADMLLEIDIQGALNVKKAFPDAVTVFIVPPSLAILRKRLADRGTETEESLAIRCAAAEKELAFMDQYDYFVVNGELQTAVDEVNAIMTAEALKMGRNLFAYKTLVEGEELK